MSAIRTVSWFQVGVEIALENLQGYVDTLEASLEKQLGDFQNWVEEQASQMSEEEREEFHDFCSDEHWQLSGVFPSTLRASLFVACYSLLELQLIGLCRSLYRKNQYSNELNYQRANVFKAKDYLTKEAGVKFPETSSAWQNIVSYYNPIRNVIVHHGGKVDGKRLKRLKPFIDANPTVSLDSFDRVRFSGEFCPEVIDTLRQFFRELLAAIPNL